MTAAQTDTLLGNHSPHPPDPAPPWPRPSLAAWVTLGLAADASMLLTLHLVVQAAIPDTHESWRIFASVGAFSAVPWIVHRTALPWLFVAVPATLWGKVSRFLCAVPYVALSTVAAPVAVLMTFFTVGIFASEIGTGLKEMGMLPTSPIAGNVAMVISMMGACAAGGAACGLLLYLFQFIRENPQGPAIRFRTDLLGGALAGAIGDSVLMSAQSNWLNPLPSTAPPLANTPLEIAVLLVATGTFALLPHLTLTGLDARAHSTSLPPPNAPPTVSPTPAPEP